MESRPNDPLVHLTDTERTCVQGHITALFVWMSKFVATAFPLTLSLSRKGRGNPRTASSYKCNPL